MIETVRPTLSTGMQWLNGSYARYVNDSHELDGHLFQGRFHSVLVEGEWHFFEVLRYLALNPVRAGLVRDPRAWPWSSYGATIGVRPAPRLLSSEDVLAHFAPDRALAIERFTRFVRDGPGA